MKCECRFWTATRFFLILFVASLAPFARAQAPLWRNDWTVQSQPTLYFFGWDQYLLYNEQPSPVVLSPDGEILFRSPSSFSDFDDQFVRLTSAGAQRWVTNLGGVYGLTQDAGAGSMLANADGSALVANDSGSYLTKIAGDGSIAWTTHVNVGFLVRLSDQVVAVGACNSIVAIDTDSGQIVWQYAFADSSLNCLGSELVTDGHGNSYATFFTAGNVGVAHAAKLDSDGHVAWNIVVPVPVFVHALGVSGSLLYVSIPADSVTSTDYAVRAIRVTDGSLAWTAASARGLTLAGSPAEVIALAYGQSQPDGQLQRLAADSGLPRWSQPLTTGVSSVNAVNGDVLVGYNSGITSTLTAFDADTGDITWSTVLPTDSNGNSLTFFAFAGLADGSLLAAAKPYDLYMPLLLQRLDSSSGQPLSPIAVPSTPHGVLEWNAVEDGQHIWGAALSAQPDGGELHIRQLNRSDGSLAWETVDSSLLFPYDASYVGIATTTDAVIVAGSVGSGVFMGAYEKATGTKRWGQALYDLFQGTTYAYDPVIDPAGNILVAYGASVSCPPGYQSCGRQTLVKLAPADGSQVWRYDNVVPAGGSQIFPQTYALIGSDVLIAGPFSGQYASSSLLRLSGVDGSVMWSAELGTQVGGIFPTDDGNVVVAYGGWSKLDAATGAILWSNSAPPNTCKANCYGYDNLSLPGGDLLFVGEGDFKPYVELLPGTQDATALSWTLEPNDPSLDSAVIQAKSDSAGNVWIRLTRAFRLGMGGISILAGMDPQTGALVSQQVLENFAYDPLATSLNPSLLSAPENNRLPVTTLAANALTPTTFGHAVLDTTVLANGDLSLQVNTESANVISGQSLGFHLVAVYTGDVAITGAKLIANLPWVGHATELSCATQAASNCVFDERSDTIRVSFDIQPGGQVDISGNIRVSPGPDSAVFYALASGPISLSESNTINNFARAFVTQSIFRDGFE